MRKVNTLVYGKSIPKVLAVLTLVIVQVFYAPLIAQTIAAANTDKGNAAPVQKIVDNGYFSYEVTGNAIRDMESYKAAKEIFIQKYPEKYKQMLSSSLQTSKHIIDKGEFEKMPANKVNEILSHPEKYQIQ